MIRIRGSRSIWALSIGVAIVVGAAASVWGFGSRFGPSGGEASGEWAEEAEAASIALTQSFWDDKRGMFNNASPCMLQLCTDPFNYWWQAHAADALLDAYERTKSEDVSRRVGELFDGILNRNAGFWPNDYYDDMEWMGLAWLRAYDLLGEEKYKTAALALWADIQTGWNEEYGGGIAWRKGQPDYKNTPANAPAVILAARLYERFGNEADLAWAKRIYEWQRSVLVDPETGLVWDGINRTGDGKIDYDWKFTYGQGVFIGAGVELYKISGDDRYLAEARRTADNAIAAIASPATGLLPNEGDGDGALFKGVFARYLAGLAAIDSAEGGRYAAFLYSNAASVRDYVQSEDGGLIGPSWAQPPEAVVPLSAQISGTMLYEQVAALERTGIQAETKS
ncbi:glycoside hydrolase family 76 protein [Cohnella sp. GCM10027633]|uniref:glycoside hydrolase family 76 protein n=1 Tax=unclassified Cohnella TaxID=2636738 RepID=UPI0036363696